jgi:hypothetical protein
MYRPPNRSRPVVRGGLATWILALHLFMQVMCVVPFVPG